MNRRTFLCGLGKFLGTAAVAAVAPKFIFDPNANLYTQESKLIYANLEYENASYEEIFIAGKFPFKLIVKTEDSDRFIPTHLMFPRRFNGAKDGSLIEVLPFKV